MMKHHGFTAREAMGWLRIVRPGSVIGEQQDYLCRVEAAIHRAGDRFRERGGGDDCRVAMGAAVEEVAGLVAAAVAAVDGLSAAQGGDGRAAVGSELPRVSSEPSIQRLAAHVESAAGARSLQRSKSQLSLGTIVGSEDAETGFL